MPDIVKCFGTCSLNVRVILRGPFWRRHIDQLQRRYVMMQTLVIPPGCPKTIPHLGATYERHLDGNYRATADVTSR